MEYRRMDAGGGLATGEGADAPYLQMLDDIQAVIECLQNKSEVYHIDTEKISLMGYSSGGHLALLYAYKAALGDYRDGDNIKLVISEAGPMYFYKKDNVGHEEIIASREICAMVGISYEGGFGENEKEALQKASPLMYAGDGLPYTILACGSQDSVVRIDQAVMFRDILNYNEGNESLPKNNCSLFELFGITHINFQQYVKPESIYSDVKKYYGLESDDERWGIKTWIEENFFTE